MKKLVQHKDYDDDNDDDKRKTLKALLEQWMPMCALGVEMRST